MTIGVAEEATNASAGNNRACSDGRGGKDECGGCKGIRVGHRGFSKMGSLCYEHRLWEELLCLRRIWAHGPSLQESGNERKSGGK